MNPAEQEIREVHTTWIDAVNAGDLAPLLTMMAEDAVFFNSAQGPFGPEKLSTTFSDAHRDLLIQCSSDLEEVVVVGEVAYTRSWDRVSATPRAGGPTTQVAGHCLSIYRKQADGRWLLARDVHTLAPVEK
jgi:uncharacterized protein (TIGR02246 family)